MYDKKGNISRTPMIRSESHIIRSSRDFISEIKIQYMKMNLQGNIAEKQQERKNAYGETKAA